jgi:hypothetical protein
LDVRIGARHVYATCTILFLFEWSVAFDVLKTGKSGAKNGNVVPKKWEK